MEAAGATATLLDTRKTTPGLRDLEKRAVAHGGGTNHRAGLYDFVLIKENHSALAGGVGEAVRRARAARPDLPLAVEVRDAAEIDEALAAGAPRLLLDNMTPERGRRRGGPGGRPRGARGLRRRDARDSCCLLDHKGATLRLDGCADALGAQSRPLPPPRDHAMTLLQLDNIPAMQAEVRALARERGAVILAHNYQLPEIQDVADYVGDSLGLSIKAAAATDEVIAFCGVHFMAETASILSPEKTVLLPDLDAGCSLADSITAEQLRAGRPSIPAPSS